MQSTTQTQITESITTTTQPHQVEAIQKFNQIVSQIRRSNALDSQSSIQADAGTEIELFSPHITNKELHFYISRDGKSVSYFTDRFYVKLDLLSNRVLIKKELCEDMLPNQIYHVTYNHDETKVLISAPPSHTNTQRLIVYDSVSGQVSRIDVQENQGHELSLGKQQGFTDFFMYQTQYEGTSVLKKFHLADKHSETFTVLSKKGERSTKFIPCCIQQLDKCFVIKLDSEKQLCSLQIYQMRLKKKVATIKIDFQTEISEFAGSHDQLTVMHYDSRMVVFGINSLLFFVDLVSYTCKLFTH